MTKQTRKRVNHGHRHLARKHDLRRRMKDRDQIQDDMEKPPVFGSTPDLPGHGQNYCITCARHFISQQAHSKHMASKAHRRRLKSIEGDRYGQEDADLAAGMTREPQSSFEKTRLAAKLTEMDVESLTTTAAVAPEVVIAVEQPVESTSWSNNLDI